MDRAVRTRAEKRTNKGGWHSTAEKKEVMLGGLRKAYALGGIIHHSEEALNEAKSYIYLGAGSIGPAGLCDESEQARKTHGDRVIGVGLAVLGLEESVGNKPVRAAPPPKSWAFRRKLRKEQAVEAQRTDRFDWRYSSR
jgi:hypothetical protein